MKVLSLFTLFLVFTAVQMSFAQAAPQAPQLFDGRSLVRVDLQTALAHVHAGTIVVLGEQHATTEQPKFQVQVLETIREMGLHVSVGMEFFEYPYQDAVDKYRQKLISEADFLKAVHWGGFPFSSYRSQVLFPAPDDFVVALNAPSALVGKIAKMGLDSLTEQDKALMPPHFTLGNSRYLERFKEIMGDHLPNPDALGRYFAAQSTWDETMAWKATDFINHHPDQVLVIVVGEFHEQYGGGLPDRLQAWGASDVLKFSLVNVHGMSLDEEKEALSPSVKYGARADYIWAADY